MLSFSPSHVAAAAVLAANLSLGRQLGVPKCSFTSHHRDGERRAAVRGCTWAKLSLFKICTVVDGACFSLQQIVV